MVTNIASIHLNSASEICWVSCCLLHLGAVCQLTAPLLPSPYLWLLPNDSSFFQHPVFCLSIDVALANVFFLMTVLKLLTTKNHECGSFLSHATNTPPVSELSNYPPHFICIKIVCFLIWLSAYMRSDNELRINPSVIKPSNDPSGETVYWSVDIQRTHLKSFHWACLCCCPSRPVSLPCACCICGLDKMLIRSPSGNPQRLKPMPDNLKQLP